MSLPDWKIADLAILTGAAVEVAPEAATEAPGEEVAKPVKQRATRKEATEKAVTIS